MNPDDEIFLSAYLDNELDPNERLAVESALQSDPHLAERLRALAIVRDLVAGLPRPPLLIDLAPALARRVASRPAISVSILPAFRTQPRAVGAGLAAATLFLAITVAVGTSLVWRPGQRLRPPKRPAVAAAPRLENPAPFRAEPPQPRPAPTANPAVASASAARAVPASRTESGALAQAREQWEFRRMLDSPDLRKVFVVTDLIGGRAAGRVGDLVGNTPRLDPRFGRAVVSQGIVIDPNHPGEATVFALVVTDPELSQFRAEIHKLFPDQVEESDPDPAAVTQLADIGQVSIIPGTAVAAVDAGQGPLLAARKDPSILGPGDETPSPETPTPEQERSAPAPYVERRTRNDIGKLARGPAAPAARVPVAARLDRPLRRGSSVVLVWVTSR